jgi:hypothetical protein
VVYARCFFRDIDGIAIPITAGATATATVTGGSRSRVGWVNSDACVWEEASSTTRSGYCVRRIYEEVLGVAALEADHALVMFFKQTLGV